MKDARIICVSGYGKEEYRQQALDAGCDDHVVKPVDWEELLGILARSEV
jgi:YesN/AraC family two-component response regulator